MKTIITIEIDSHGNDHDMTPEKHHQKIFNDLHRCMQSATIADLARLKLADNLHQVVASIRVEIV